MIVVLYTKTFLKKFSKLDPFLKEEIYEKIELFKQEKNHKKLRVHKLTKPFVDKFSFSINYKIRIMFVYNIEDENEVFFLTAGSHQQVYKK